MTNLKFKWWDLLLSIDRLLYRILQRMESKLDHWDFGSAEYWESKDE